MAKKIYDIKPPKVAKKTIKRENPKVDIPEVLVEAKIETPRSDVKEKNHSILKPVLIGVLLFVIMVGVYLFFKLPKADINIWPKVDILSFKQTVIADKSASSVDVTNNAIPAQYFQVLKTNSQDFPATGNASNEGKAEGTITVYNKYDPPDSFTFKSGTRFISDSGKLFVSLQKTLIPAAKKSGSSITPGSVQIQVQAVEGGNDYNIAPASFSIPGLKGTPYYYSVYATSTKAMAGGYTGKVKKITDDDIQGAKDVLTKKTTSDAMSDLKNKIPSDYVLLDNAVLSNVTNASTKTKSGEIVENFNYQVTVQASGLAFKKSDVDQFAKSFIISQMPNGKTLLDNTFKDDYSASTVDVSGGKATINLNCSASVYQNIDKNSMALSLIGKNTDQINQTINNSLKDQISKVEINFWPFWVKSAPNSQKAINVELKF
ncbi:MAG: hypothetical protein NT094_01185 [Candidatus Staskawiczbacteria bacterium]|nr:hypothetical protein [Candidatus Staskawiczbacteria bacterium]